MFYCDPCGKPGNWPVTMFRSRGRCEVCGNVRDCSEMASKWLPEIPCTNKPSNLAVDIPPTPLVRTAVDMLVKRSMTTRTYELSPGALAQKLNLSAKETINSIKMVDSKIFIETTEFDTEVVK